MALSGSYQTGVNPLEQLRLDATAALAALTPNALAAAIVALNLLASLPTSDPGGGRVWSNGGVLQVGP